MMTPITLEHINSEINRVEREMSEGKRYLEDLYRMRAALSPIRITATTSGANPVEKARKPHFRAYKGSALNKVKDVMKACNKPLLSSEIAALANMPISQVTAAIQNKRRLDKFCRDENKTFFKASSLIDERGKLCYRWGLSGRAYHSEDKQIIQSQKAPKSAVNRASKNVVLDLVLKTLKEYGAPLLSSEIAKLSNLEANTVSWCISNKRNSDKQYRRNEDATIVKMSTELSAKNCRRYKWGLSGWTGAVATPTKMSADDAASKPVLRIAVVAQEDEMESIAEAVQTALRDKKLIARFTPDMSIVYPDRMYHANKMDYTFVMARAHPKVTAMIERAVPADRVVKVSGGWGSVSNAILELLKDPATTRFDEFGRKVLQDEDLTATSQE